MTIVTAEHTLWVVVAGLLGLAVGSFLNVVIHRVPAGLSIVSPPSRCPSCDHDIRNRHNVPVIGWLVLRGGLLTERTSIEWCDEILQRLAR